MGWGRGKQRERRGGGQRERGGRGGGGGGIMSLNGNVYVCFDNVFEYECLCVIMCLSRSVCVCVDTVSGNVCVLVTCHEHSIKLLLTPLNIQQVRKDIFCGLPLAIQHRRLCQR